MEYEITYVTKLSLVAKNDEDIEVKAKWFARPYERVEKIKRVYPQKIIYERYDDKI